MDLKDLQREAHEIAREKGWHDEPRSVAHLIALCHSELSEALEEARKVADPALLLIWGSHTVIDGQTVDNPKPEGFAIELADLVIRVLDMAELYGVNLEAAIEAKMDYNRTRPYKHGKQF